MVLDKLNEALRDIGSGKIVANLSGDTIKYGILIIIVGIALIACLDILKHLKRKGSVTKPSVDRTGHAAIIAEMINTELDKLYENQRAIQGLHDRLRDYRQTGQPARIHLDTSNVVMRSQVMMGFFHVVKYRLDSRDNVASGEFGTLYLNRYFFGSRTMHHHYSMMIAARLFFLQAYALSGKDPKSIVSKEAFMKKAGESVLALAGNLKEYAALREKDVLNFTRHDRKVDERILQTLNLSDERVQEVEEELKAYSRTAYDALTNKGMSVAGDVERLLTLLKKEKEHLIHIQKLAQEKAADLNRLLRTQGIAEDEREVLGIQLHRFSGDVHRLELLIANIQSVEDNVSRWKLKHSDHNHRIRRSRHGLNAAARDIRQELDESSIDIHKVHAILSAISTEKAELLKDVRAMEAVR